MREQIYPVQPRLSPDGRYWICDECGREWKLGQGSNCQPCLQALEQMERSRDKGQLGWLR